MRASPPPPLGPHFGSEREMGEKVSEAPEPVPRGCSSHGAPTPAPAVAAESSPGASSAESSSGSETLSEEGEPGFSREQPPPPPPGGARPAAAWAPALSVPERGVSAPPPRPGGAAPPAPRGSSASQEEQDEEVGPAFPTSTPLVRAARRPQLSTPHASGGQCALGHGAGKGPQVLCAVPRVMTVRSLAVGHWFPSGCHLCVCVFVYMCWLTVCLYSIKAANSFRSGFAPLGV